MSTIVFRFDVTWTTTSSGGWTKTTLPGNTSANNVTLDYPDPALSAIAEVVRQKIADSVLALDPNANVNCTLSTKTVT